MKHRKKKNIRFRGSKTHGWGAKKKHRGAGHRGGHGRSGSGKRGDQKKPSYWKYEKPGKVGFTSKSRTLSLPITLQYIQDHKDTLPIDSHANLDLTQLGFHKLLATGKISTKLNIIIPFATERAIAKIKKAGGSVTTSEKKSE
jgi:large subunit ribosomal protein L15